MNPSSLILASASPRRAELLRQLGLEFKILPSDASELHCEHLTAAELCRINACRKARVMAQNHPEALVMGVDTLVTLGTKLFGKPADLPEARHMLAQLQGRTHHVFTGVCLLHRGKKQQRAFVEMTEVVFRPLTTAQIDHYLALVNPLDKAGAYGIQEHGDEIVREIKGSFSNVVGLPLERLQQELADTSAF